jgi:hypothetical protein
MKQTSLSLIKQQPDGEVRAFLSEELEHAYHAGGGFTTVDHLEKTIRELQKKLAAVQRYQALETIMKDRGWDMWDMSEYFPSIEGRHYSFVGTNDEWNALEDQLVNNKND